MPTPTTQVVPRKADLLPTPVTTLVQSLVPDCGKLLPPDISTDQFRAALWLELTGRPDLHDCTPQSLRDCVVKAATYGLLPGRDCYFLPFKNRKGNTKVATYVPSYQGILLALERSGKVRRAFAHPVYDGDLWEYDHFADRPTHKPAFTIGHKQGPELFYYGAIQFHDSSFAVDILSLEELDKIRRSSPAHEQGPWIDWPEMMKRKTALKRVAKYVKLTPLVAGMLEDDTAREREDIPPERHLRNITDLFGDDARGSTPQAPSGPVVDTTTGEVVEHAETPERLHGAAGGQNPPSAPTDPDVAWRRTLRAHQGTLVALRQAAKDDPDALERLDTLAEAIDFALSPLSTTSDSEGLHLAAALLDWVDAR